MLVSLQQVLYDAFSLGYNSTANNIKEYILHMAEYCVDKANNRDIIFIIKGTWTSHDHMVGTIRARVHSSWGIVSISGLLYGVVYSNEMPQYNNVYQYNYTTL